MNPLFVKLNTATGIKIIALKSIAWIEPVEKEEGKTLIRLNVHDSGGGLISFVVERPFEEVAAVIPKITLHEKGDVPFVTGSI